MKPKRTFFIWSLAASFFLWSLLGWLRLVETISIWNLLTHTFITPQPEYLLFSAVCWGAAGLVFTLGLLFRWHWARSAPLAALGFVLWYWTERVVLTRAETAWVNSAFTAAVSILWLGYGLWVTAFAKRNGYFKGCRAASEADRSGDD